MSVVYVQIVPNSCDVSIEQHLRGEREQAGFLPWLRELEEPASKLPHAKATEGHALRACPPSRHQQPGVSEQRVSQIDEIADVQS